MVRRKPQGSPDSTLARVCIKVEFPIAGELVRLAVVMYQQPMANDTPKLIAKYAQVEAVRNEWLKHG